MRVLGLVPARGGSQRVPRKNLARLGGRSLVRRALETCAASGVLDEIVLSSDDDEILAEAEGLAGVTALKRPDELATSHARAYDVAGHVLAAMEQRTSPFEAIALVQATTPFTDAADIRGVIEMLERPETRSVVTVKRIDDLIHPLKLKRFEGDLLVPFIRDDELTPSHDLPELWTRNGAVYASRVDVLREGILVAADAHGYRMPEERSIDVNTPLDLAFAEFLLSRKT